MCSPDFHWLVSIIVWILVHCQNAAKMNSDLHSSLPRPSVFIFLFFSAHNASHKSLAKSRNKRNKTKFHPSGQHCDCGSCSKTGLNGGLFSRKLLLIVTQRLRLAKVLRCSAIQVLRRSGSIRNYGHNNKCINAARLCAASRSFCTLTKLETVWVASTISFLLRLVTFNITLLCVLNITYICYTGNICWLC